MARLSILNHEGDLEVPFTREDYAKAQEEFDVRVKKHNYLAFATDTKGSNRVIKSFDSTAEDITLVRQVVGG